MSQSEFDSGLPEGIGLAPYLRMKQEGMTENESRIVEWLLKPGNLSSAPAIKDVAEALAVSEQASHANGNDDFPCSAVIHDAGDFCHGLF